jgi:hypothetical protein
MFYIIFLLSQINAYCFPEEISNQTNTGLCTLIVKESSGCGFFRIGAGLVQLTMSCYDNSTQYNLPSSEDGNNVGDAVSKLTQVLQTNYSILPNCTQSSGLYFKQYCSTIVYYTQQVCTFQIPDDEIYGPTCSGSSVFSSLMLIAIIIWFIII